MSNIFRDPIPFNTVFTSEKDVEVNVVANGPSGTTPEYIRLAKATNLSFVHTNAAGIQRFASEIVGRTYSGNKRVAGTISGMFLDESWFKLVVGSEGTIQNLHDLLTNVNEDEWGINDRYQWGGVVIRFSIDTKRLRGYTTHYLIKNVVFDSHGYHLPSVGRITQSVRFIGTAIDVEYSTT